MVYRRVWVSSSARLGVIFLGVLLEAGCTSYLSSGDTSQSALPPQRESSEYVNLSTFPPQRVMESSEYARFLADNSRMLEQCQQGTGCEIALFNLGFVYAYPQSPYYDPPKALQYFDELLKRYPQTPWAFESQAWRALINENLASEEKRRRLEAEFRAKDAMIRSLQTQLNRSRETDEAEFRAKDATIHSLQMQLDRSREVNEAESRAKDDTIHSLQMQLNRSREIDIEYDKKKWELLH
jgi:hypothetical protein